MVGLEQVARPENSHRSLGHTKTREHTMARFVQQSWVVVIFVAAMLAMQLSHRGGHRGGTCGRGGRPCVTRSSDRLICAV